MVCPALTPSGMVTNNIGVFIMVVCLFGLRVCVCFYVGSCRIHWSPQKN